MSAVLNEELLSVEGQGILDLDAAFPINALGQTPITWMALELSRVENVPVEFAALLCLSAVSAGCLGGIAVKSIRGKVTTPHLYSIVGARSGVGKSEVVKQAFAPIYNLEKSMISNWRANVQPGLQAQGELLEAKVKKVAKGADIDSELGSEHMGVKDLAAVKRQLDEVHRSLQSPRMIYEDCTQEALALGLSQNAGKVSMVSSDARKAIKNLMGSYKSGETDEDVLLKAFSGDQISVDRIGRDAGPPITNPQMSVFLTVQLDLFNQFVGHSSFLESGLLPRFLMTKISVEPQYISTTGVDDEIYPSVIEGYRMRLEDIARVFRIGVTTTKPDIIDTQPGAREAIVQFTNECVTLQRGELRDIGSCVARWGELTWRLALVLHVAHYGKDSARMPLQHCFAVNAVRLMKWFAAQQVCVLSAGRQQRKVARQTALIRHLIPAEGNSMSVRDLVKNNGFTKEELEQLVADSPGMLVMDEVPPGPQGGRPSTVIRMVE